ncbi:hypothetical protein AgCh_029195 [Apium graveolens]
MAPTLQHGKLDFAFMQYLKESKVWMAIEDGVHIPTKIVDDILIEKKVNEYNLEEEATMNIAAKAEMVLTSALAEKEYKRENNYKSAQEMWNKLVVTYEGTTDIKDSRMETLIQDYENIGIIHRRTYYHMLISLCDSTRFVKASSEDEYVEDITGTFNVKKEIDDLECSKEKIPSGNIL